MRRTMRAMAAEPACPVCAYAYIEHLDLCALADAFYSEGCHRSFGARTCWQIETKKSTISRNGLGIRVQGLRFESSES